MKTAEQIAEKWAEHCGVVTEGDEQNFLAALHEYGAAVRQRAAGVVEEVALEWVKSPPLTVRKPTAAVYREAIERMELP